MAVGHVSFARLNSSSRLTQQHETPPATLACLILDLLLPSRCHSAFLYGPCGFLRTLHDVLVKHYQGDFSLI